MGWREGVSRWMRKEKTEYKEKWGQGARKPGSARKHGKLLKEYKETMGGENKEI